MLQYSTVFASTTLIKFTLLNVLSKVGTRSACSLSSVSHNVHEVSPCALFLSYESHKHCCVVNLSFRLQVHMRNSFVEYVALLQDTMAEWFKAKVLGLLLK
jgi:hypothetical protein